MSFEYITIVHVNGLGANSLGGQLAISKSMQELPGSKGLLLSPYKPIRLLEGIKHISTPRIERQDYSFFMVYALHQYIDTDFVLVVQEDGWVLNGSVWKEEFTQYDYLGAPIHLAKIKGITHQGFTWTNHYEGLQNVFNGGFSLRSKAFLEAPARFSIPYIINAPIGMGNFPNLLLWEDECNKEDVQLCLYMRESLEKLGIRFPTLEIAKYFSFEHLTPRLHEKLDLKTVLGHHSSRRRIRSFKHIHYTESYDTISSIYGEKQILDLFNFLNYNLSFA